MWTCNELSVNALIMKSNVVLQTACVDRMNPNKMHTFEHEGKRGPFAGKAFLKTSKMNKKIKKKNRVIGRNIDFPPLAIKKKKKMASLFAKKNALLLHLYCHNCEQ